GLCSLFLCKISR
nr:immunoglobulin heavy chain junction region [Mus musculus]